MSAPATRDLQPQPPAGEITGTMWAMDKWPVRKLDELGFLGRGKSKHRPRNDPSLYGGKYPFFQTGDIKAAHFHLTEYSQTYNEKGLAQSKLWQPGTLCITIAANIGETAILSVPGCFPDSVVGFVPDPEKADVRFIKYYIDSIKLQMQGLSHGTTQDNLSLDKLLTFDFHAPQVAIQCRIADILSAYDDLIENNLRRIKILEEMARALYREWFVEFDLPGVSSISSSLPRGWGFSRLGDHLTSLETGTRPKGGVRDEIEGVPSIGAENIDGIGRHKYESEKHVSREFFQQMKRGIVRDRDVAIYKDGAYIGKSSYFRDGFPHAECCVNEHVFLVRPDGVRLTPNALYLWLQESDTLHAIWATNANAAQPGINQQSMNGLELILPDPETALKFEKITEPLLAEIINLAKRNRNLRRTRDLLLPHLLNGDLPPASR